MRTLPPETAILAEPSPPPADPAVAAEPERLALQVPLRPLGFGDPLRWLAAGWQGAWRHR